MIKERKYHQMPKNISFRKPVEKVIEKMPLKENEKFKRHQKKLEKSQVDSMISKTKGEL